MKDYEVIYDSENFIVVNKKSGILAHKNKFIQTGTLIDSINEDFGGNFYLVHRIDKDTSGLLLVAKNKESATKLQDLFVSSNIKKEYLAITSNFLPAKEIKISLSIGRNKSNKCVFSSWNANKYKTACTRAYKLDQKLILLNLETGRTHQIRSHLFSIKCPILNDPIYGSSIEGDDFGQYLHAYKLSFINPFTDEYLVITCPPPEEFFKKLQELKIKYELPKKSTILINQAP